MGCSLAILICKYMTDMNEDELEYESDLQPEITNNYFVADEEPASAPYDARLEQQLEYDETEEQIAQEEEHYIVAEYEKDLLQASDLEQDATGPELSVNGTDDKFEDLVEDEQSTPDDEPSEYTWNADQEQYEEEYEEEYQQFDEDDRDEDHYKEHEDSESHEEVDYIDEADQTDEHEHSGTPNYDHDPLKDLEPADRDQEGNIEGKIGFNHAHQYDLSSSSSDHVTHELDNIAVYLEIGEEVIKLFPPNCDEDPMFRDLPLLFSTNSIIEQPISEIFDTFKLATSTPVDTIVLFKIPALSNLVIRSDSVDCRTITLGNILHIFKLLRDSDEKTYQFIQVEVSKESGISKQLEKLKGMALKAGVTSGRGTGAVVADTGSAKRSFSYEADETPIKRLKEERAET